MLLLKISNFFIPRHCWKWEAADVLFLVSLFFSAFQFLFKEAFCRSSDTVIGLQIPKVNLQLDHKLRRFTFKLMLWSSRLDFYFKFLFIFFNSADDQWWIQNLCAKVTKAVGPRWWWIRTSCTSHNFYYYWSLPMPLHYLPSTENDPYFYCAIIWLAKITLKTPHVIFNPLCVSLYCDYSTWGNCGS